MEKEIKNIEIEEYISCREKIAGEINQINNIEQNAVYAVAAILYYLLTGAGITGIYLIFGWIAVIFICVFGQRKYNAHRKIIRIFEKFQFDKFEKHPDAIDGSIRLQQFYEKWKLEPIEKIVIDVPGVDQSKSGSLRWERNAHWVILFAVTTLLLFAKHFYVGK